MAATWLLKQLGRGFNDRIVDGWSWTLPNADGMSRQKLAKWTSAIRADSRFTSSAANGIVHNVKGCREHRKALGLTQRDFAQLVGVPLNTLRTWDSGLRSIPLRFVGLIQQASAGYRSRHELLPLARLAREIHVNIHTLRAAVRLGCLEATHSTRSAFGRPIVLATRAAGESYLRNAHGKPHASRPAATNVLPAAPVDFDCQLRALRKANKLSQAGFARRIGAANKAVIYQWEARKRRPSPVFWRRVLREFCGPRVTG